MIHTLSDFLLLENDIVVPAVLISSQYTVFYKKSAYEILTATQALDYSNYLDSPLSQLCKRWGRCDRKHIRRWFIPQDTAGEVETSVNSR